MRNKMSLVLRALVVSIFTIMLITVFADRHEANAAIHVHSYRGATCTSPRRCTRCGATSGSALGHNVVDDRVQSYATCTSAGVVSRKCSRCGAGMGSRTTAALGHNYVTFNCTQDKCSRCSSTRAGGSGHNTVDDKVQKAATCSSTGVMSLKCSKCNAGMGSRTIAALGHKYIAFNCTQDKCSVCGITKAGGYGHNVVDDKVQKEATCTTTGIMSLKCSSCNGGMGSRTIAAYGHSYKNSYTNPTCEMPGFTVTTCTNYGCTYSVKSGTTQPLGHIWNTVSTTPATCINDGAKVEKCSRSGCGKSNTCVIPKDPNKHNLVGGICTVCHKNTNTEIIFIAGEDKDSKIAAMDFDGQNEYNKKFYTNNDNVDVTAEDYNFDEVNNDDILGLLDSASFFEYLGHGYYNGAGTYMSISTNRAIYRQSVAGMDLSNLYVASLQCCYSAGNAEKSDDASESIGYAVCQSGAKLVIGYNISASAIYSASFSQEFNRYYAQILENADKISDVDLKDQYIVDMAYELAMTIAEHTIKNGSNYEEYYDALVVFKNEGNGNVSVNTLRNGNPNVLYEVDSNRMKFIDEALEDYQ